MYVSAGAFFLLSPLIWFLGMYWAIRLAIRHEARRTERRREQGPGAPVPPPPPLTTGR
jgi:hypothetical protein